jgi:hypothetical protein
MANAAASRIVGALLLYAFTRGTLAAGSTAGAILGARRRRFTLAGFALSHLANTATQGEPAR